MLDYLNQEFNDLSKNNDALKDHIELLIKINNQHSPHKYDIQAVLSHNVTFKKMKTIFSPFKDQIKY